MQVKLAAVSGFCGNDGQFGVSGAIKIAQQAALDYPDQVYIVGDLVHNDHVTHWLQDSYGIHFVTSLDKVPAKKVLVIKAHGAPPAFIEQAQAKNLRLIDATCPMVKAAQKLVVQFVSQGKEIIYVASSPTHDEAVSVSHQVDHGVKVVTVDQLDKLKIKHPDNTVVLTQTTLSVQETSQKFALLAKKYPTLTIRPHMCQATTQRQQAVLDLAPTVDILIVVGAPHSSNSQRLLEVAQSTGKPAYAVDNVDQLQATWFDHTMLTVGVIAGASTPAWVTQAVVDKLQSL
ncbi:4-hydroxy-3-methylbut-2-enyl diphosphate reductase [bacterium]|nr:4-hydroxy-3-methylbut-2-enyl diphosphate reductase [bacterium]